MHAIKTFGEVDQRSLEQLKRCMAAGDADFGVLCADHHPGYSQPIGGGIAYEGHVSPSGVGFDIGCGNKAVRTDLTRADLDARGGVEPLMREITRRVSFGMGVAAQERVDHPVLDQIARADFAPQRKLLNLAREQLGTVGSGNHYVDLFEDEAGTIWIGVHFGSRGFGHKTASGFLALAQGLGFGERAHEGEMDSPPVLFPVESELGQAYVAAMNLAGEYAYAGRDVVCAKVLEILGAESTHEVHNHHNFCIPGDAIVATIDGPKRMDEIERGDQVYAFDSRSGLVASAVTGHWSSGRKPIVTIATANRKLRASEDHPVLVVDLVDAPHPERPWHRKRRGEYRWKRAGEVRPGDVLVCASSYNASGEGIGIDTARFVGAFLGDGWVRHSRVHVSGYGVGLAIGDAAQPHTARYLDLCHSLFAGSTWKNNGAGAYGLTCSSKATHAAVTALDLARRAREKRVPGYAFRLPRPEKLALLAGYFDADGNVSNGNTSNHGRGTIASTSRDLVAGLRELAISCGLRVTNVAGSTRSTNFGVCRVYRCVIDAADMGCLDLWHDAKRANIRTGGRASQQGLEPAAVGYLDLPQAAFAQRVRSVMRGDEEDVYDLAVAHPSHSFVCEGVVVHNCWREEHFGRAYWVVRKGCTPARPGQEGFVGGSMGDISVILEGVGSDEAAEALFSTVHGAGRVMSRSQAAGKIRRATVFACSSRDCDFTVPAKGYKGETCPRHPGSRMRKLRVQHQVRPGLVDWEAVRRRLREQEIVVLGGGADEAPEVYKRLPDVLAAHAGSIRVKHTLRPLGVAMAGADVYDPYKD